MGKAHTLVKFYCVVLPDSLFYSSLTFFLSAALEEFIFIDCIPQCNVLVVTRYSLSQRFARVNRLPEFQQNGADESRSIAHNEDVVAL